MISYWIWEQEHIDDLESTLAPLFEKFPDKRKMLGMYGVTIKKPMQLACFQKQLEAYVKLLEDGKIEGIIFCSDCVGDTPLLTNNFLKDFIAKNGDREI